MRPGLLSGRFKRRLRSAQFAVGLVAVLTGCAPATKDTPREPSSTISPIPVIYVIGGLVPEIMGPSREFEGLWAITFEGSRFHEGALKPTDIPEGKELDTWLDPWRSGIALQQPNDPRLNEFNEATGQYYVHYMRVKFIGRRNVFPGLYGFGHLGVSDKMVLIEKVISAKIVAVE